MAYIFTSDISNFEIFYNVIFRLNWSGLASQFDNCHSTLIRTFYSITLCCSVTVNTVQRQSVELCSLWRQKTFNEIYLCGLNFLYWEKLKEILALTKLNSIEKIVSRQISGFLFLFRFFSIFMFLFGVRGTPPHYQLLCVAYSWVLSR